MRARDPSVPAHNSRSLHPSGATTASCSFISKARCWGLQKRYSSANIIFVWFGYSSLCAIPCSEDDGGKSSKGAQEGKDSITPDAAQNKAYVIALQQPPVISCSAWLGSSASSSPALSEYSAWSARLSANLQAKAAEQQALAELPLPKLRLARKYSNRWMQFANIRQGLDLRNSTCHLESQCQPPPSSALTRDDWPHLTPRFLAH